MHRSLLLGHINPNDISFFQALLLLFVGLTFTCTAHTHTCAHTQLYTPNRAMGNGTNTIFFMSFCRNVYICARSVEHNVYMCVYIVSVCVCVWLCVSARVLVWCLYKRKGVQNGLSYVRYISLINSILLSLHLSFSYSSVHKLCTSSAPFALFIRLFVFDLT